MTNECPSPNARRSTEAAEEAGVRVPLGHWALGIGHSLDIGHWILVIGSLVSKWRRWENGRLGSRSVVLITAGLPSAAWAVPPVCWWATDRRPPRSAREFPACSR